MDLSDTENSSRTRGSHSFQVDNKHKGHKVVSGYEAANLWAQVKGRGADIKMWLKNKTIDTWATVWQQTRTNFTAKIKNYVGIWKDLPKSRDQQVLSRLRTGHTRISHNCNGGVGFRKQCGICRVLTMWNILSVAVRQRNI